MPGWSQLGRGEGQEQIKQARRGWLSEQNLKGAHKVSLRECEWASQSSACE